MPITAVPCGNRRRSAAERRRTASRGADSPHEPGRGSRSRVLSPSLKAGGRASWTPEAGLRDAGDLESLSVAGERRGAQMQRLADERGGGGGGRTRTYEGLASGFTVRPLCRSGHSPASDEAFVCPRERKRLGRAEAMGLMLPCRAACQPKNPGLSQRAGRRAEAGLAWRQGLGLERTITASKGLPQ